MQTFEKNSNHANELSFGGFSSQGPKVWKDMSDE